MNRSDRYRGYIPRGMSYMPLAVADALFIARLFIISSSCTHVAHRPFVPSRSFIPSLNIFTLPIFVETLPKCSENVTHESAQVLSCRCKREKMDSTRVQSVALEHNGHFSFSSPRFYLPLARFFRLSPGKPLLLSAITYVGVTMLMRIPRASGYLQRAFFPLPLSAVAPDARSLRAFQPPPSSCALIRVRLH